MARGWESKSVEMQMEEARNDGRTGPNALPDSGARRALELLQLSRTRIADELEKATDERLRQLKQRALNHIECEIAKVHPAITHLDDGMA